MPADGIEEAKNATSNKSLKKEKIGINRIMPLRFAIIHSVTFAFCLKNASTPFMQNIT